MQEIKFNSVLRTDTITKVSYIINEISVAREYIDEISGFPEVEYQRVQLASGVKELQGDLNDLEIINHIKSLYEYKNWVE